MKRINILGAVAAALLLTASLGLSACDSTISESDTGTYLSESSGDLTAVLASDLGLTGDQQSQFYALFAKHMNGDQPEPGVLWYVAADLQERLTDDQKQRLFERAAAGPEEGPGYGFRHGESDPFGPRFGGASGRHQGFGQSGRLSEGFGPLDEILTDEQKEQAQAIREAVREQLEAVKAALDAGEITIEDARAQAQEIHASVRTQIEALLTDEQKAELEAMRAQREAEHEARRQAAADVRNEVLGLTAEQIEEFDAISEANRTVADGIREQVRNQALTREEAQAAMLELRDDRYDQLGAILDDTQLEIVQIHDALAVRMRHQRMQGPEGGRGHNGGAGFGPGGSGGPFGGGFGFGSRG